jgi:hypothetical protein
LLHGRDRLAAVLVALSAWFRLVHVAFVVALPRKVWTVAMLTLVPLGLWQLLIHGDFVGYSDQQAQFSLGYLTSGAWLEVVGNPAYYANWQFYPLVLLGASGGVLPVLAVLAALGLRRHWDAVAGFAVKIVALNVAVYLFYFFQSARFMLPAISVLIVYAAAWFGTLGARGKPARSSADPGLPLIIDLRTASSPPPRRESVHRGP